MANPYLKRTSIPKDHVPTNKNIEQPSANKRLHPLLNTENPQIGTACYYCIPGLHSQHWPTNQFQKVAPTNVYIHYEYRQLLVFYLQKLLSISALSRGFVPARECNRASTIHSSTVLRIKQPFSVPLTQKISPLKVVAKKKGEKKKKKNCSSSSSNNKVYRLLRIITAHATFIALGLFLTSAANHDYP